VLRAHRAATPPAGDEAALEPDEAMPSDGLVAVRRV